MQITHQCNREGLPDYPSKVKLSDVNIWMHDSGMLAIHDYSCPACRNNPAVLSLSNGVMNPCWECQRDGWTLTKTKGKEQSEMKVLKLILSSLAIVLIVSYFITCLMAHQLLKPIEFIIDWTEWVPVWFVYLAVYYWLIKD